MRARTRDAFAQLLASLMVLVLGPFGILLYFMLRPRETLAEKYERSLEEEALLQDIEERHICPGCKQPIEPDYVLCPICHTRLRQSCVHCGRLIHPRWSVCPYCATSQRPIPGVERAGQITLLDLEKEETLSPTNGGLLGQVDIEEQEPYTEGVASSRDDSEEQIPVPAGVPSDTPTDVPTGVPTGVDLEEPSTDTPNGDIESTWQPPPPETPDSTRKTQPLDVKAEEEETRRPLSLFGQR
jgi:RNA polymerase subunit RPABC4/transcription elongation factor Spt4